MEESETEANIFVWPSTPGSSVMDVAVEAVVKRVTFVESDTVSSAAP